MDLKKVLEYSGIGLAAYLLYEHFVASNVANTSIANVQPTLPTQLVTNVPTVFSANNPYTTNVNTATPIATSSIPVAVQQTVPAINQNAITAVANSILGPPAPMTPVPAFKSPYYIDETMQKEMYDYYIKKSNTLTNPDFWGWWNVYGSLYNKQLPFNTTQVLTEGYGVVGGPISVTEFANFVNQWITKHPSLNGLGILAIPGNIAYSVQNHRLPANLELYNALLK